MLSTPGETYKAEVKKENVIPEEAIVNGGLTVEGLDEVEEIQVPGETKEQAFKRVVSKRVDGVIYYLRNISKTAGSSRYEYTEEDINKVFDYMQKALDKARAAFSEEFMPPLDW